MTTWYVEPETGGGSPAGSGTEADPFNGLADLVSNTGSIAAGDEVLFAAGDYTAEGTFSFTKNYTSAVVLKANGVVELDRISVDGVQNHQYEGFLVRDHATFGISHKPTSTRTTDGIVHKNTVVTGNGTNGIQLTITDAGYDPAAITHFEYSGVYAATNGTHGVMFRGRASGGIMRHVTATGNSPTASGWGVYVVADNDKFATGWTQVGVTDSWERTLDGAHTVVQVTCAGNTGGARWFTEGTYEADGSGLSAGEWAQSGTTLQVQLGTGLNPNNFSVVAVYSGDCENVNIEDCEAFEQDDAFDGTGIGNDHTTKSCAIRRSRSYSNPGPCFSRNHNEDFVSESLVGYGATGNSSGNDIGHQANNPFGTGNVRQCTMASNDAEQFKCQFIDSGQTVTHTNCIAYGGTYGARALNNDGTVNWNYSCANGASTANTSGTTDSNSITTDPKLIAPTSGNLRIDGDSPCIGTGTQWFTQSTQPHDYEGRRYRVTSGVDMGAYAVRPDMPYTRKVTALQAGVLLAGVDIAKAKAA